MGTDRKGTLTDAIEAVSTMEIVEEFDIPHRTRRGKTYLLCPGHEDKHFGSCYIDKNDNGYYCYACGEHVNKWNMVLKLNGNDKSAACDWFFKMSGLTPASEHKESRHQKALHFIRVLEQYIKNDVVYEDLHVCEKKDSSYGRNINGQYLFSDVCIANPLMELYKYDKDEFQRVVLCTLKKKRDKAQKFLHFCQKNQTDCIYVEGLGPVQYGDMVHACMRAIETIDKLAQETQLLLLPVR